MTNSMKDSVPEEFVEQVTDKALKAAQEFLTFMVKETLDMVTGMTVCLVHVFLALRASPHW
eukprot:CAMPEP_0117583008 /NCGR_PEP_ID=MMETSP0784-20121206/66757_1 /TAXON_ID=39447 /ORGANISM="" /LENGTH=60 /DNA_ID=CAMNT_0005383609 /DNA_START=47 /DNA_END=229 /DNA_ORIENTATION=-